jgi:hypothetical protein
VTTRIIVCGSRDWDDVETLELELARVFPNWEDKPDDYLAFVMVHGACPTGADALANRWAEQTNPHLIIERHPADWKTHGKSAGPKRNEHMASLGAKCCLAFWDGESRGTADMIKRCINHGIPVRIYPPQRTK